MIPQLVIYYALYTRVSSQSYAEEYCSQFLTCERCAGRHHDREFTECVWCPTWESCISIDIKCRAGYRERVDCPLLSMIQYNETFARVYGTPLIAAAQGTHSQMRNCLSTVPGNVQLLKRFAIKTTSGDRADGYVAIDYTSRAIIASFSSVVTGNKLFYTHSNAEFFTNRQAQFEGSDGLVNRYLYDSWFKLWYILGMEETLKEVTKNNSGYEIWFVGHSLGGAKAEMSVLSMLLKKAVAQDKVRLLTFGSTRVGDMSFVNLIEALVPYRFRIVHGRDMLPRYPRKFDGEWTPPHHHRYEVWYPNGMGPGAKYFVCLGAEDPQCSSRLSPWEIRAVDNDFYFERSMQHWAESFCDASIRIERLQSAIRYVNMREPSYDMSSVRTQYPAMATIPTTSAHPFLSNARFYLSDGVYTRLPNSPLWTTTISQRSTTHAVDRTTVTSSFVSPTPRYRTVRIVSSTPAAVESTTQVHFQAHHLNNSSADNSTIKMRRSKSSSMRRFPRNSNALTLQPGKLKFCEDRLQAI